MGAKKSLKYEIVCLESWKPYRKPVMGYPLALSMPGTYALRQQHEYLWIVDHVETGCKVCEAPAREDAIDKVRQMAKNKGEAGFLKAIEAAQEKIAGLQF